MARGNNLLFNPPRMGRGSSDEMRSVDFFLSEKPLGATWDGQVITFISKDHLHRIQPGKNPVEEKCFTGEPIGFSHDGVISIEPQSKQPIFATYKTAEGMESSHSVIGSEGLEAPLLKAFPFIQDGTVVIYGLDEHGFCYLIDVNISLPSTKHRWQVIDQGKSAPHALFADKGGLFLVYNKGDYLRGRCLYPDGSSADIAAVNRHVISSGKMVFLDQERLFLYGQQDVIGPDGDKFYHADETITDLSASGSLLAVLGEENIYVVDRGKAIFKEPLKKSYNQVEFSGDRLLLIDAKEKQASLLFLKN